MPRDAAHVCRSVLTAYFERRSATARALAERPGLADKPEELPWSAELVEHRRRDTRILEWLLNEAPASKRVETARRVLVVWMLEWVSEHRPQQLLEVLQYDLDYLHVLEFSTRLAKTRPLGLDPMTKRERDGFRRALGRVFWRKRTQFPPAPELLRTFHHLRQRIADAQDPPGLDGMDEPWRSSLDAAFDYGDPQLEKHVARARLTWLALPAEFAAAWERRGRLDDPALQPGPDAHYLDKVVWEIVDIGADVEAGKFDRAATTMLACFFSTAETDPHDVARKKIEQARQQQAGVPLEVFLDHREWAVLDDAKVVRGGALSFSRVAQLEGVTPADIAALEPS